MGLRVMMGTDDMVEFFGEVSMILDDNDVEVDKDFPEKYTRAMNRLRYIQDKERPVKVKVTKASRVIYDTVSCGNCGFDLTHNRHYKFCPNCGYGVIQKEFGKV